MRAKATKTFNLTDETIERIKTEQNQSQTIEAALKFYWEFKDKGKQLISSADDILKLVNGSKPVHTNTYQQNNSQTFSATPREDEIDDPILAEERRNKPELRIKRNDDSDLVYWEKRINNWKVMYP